MDQRFQYEAFRSLFVKFLQFFLQLVFPKIPLRAISQQIWIKFHFPSFFIRLREIFQITMRKMRIHHEHTTQSSSPSWHRYWKRRLSWVARVFSIEIYTNHFELCSKCFRIFWCVIVNEGIEFQYFSSLPSSAKSSILHYWTRETENWILRSEAVWENVCAKSVYGIKCVSRGSF